MEKKEELKFGGATMSLPADLRCLQGGGGAEGEAALATLEKQLICPICLELFNKPVVILPCQHNLCRKCANELYQARTTMLVNSGRFRCPSCRHEVVLDRHGVYGLQRNLLVENIIDVYKQEVCNNSNATSPVPPPPAQVTCADHESEKVNIYCLTCQVPTCSLCKVFGAHQSCQVAPLTDVYQQQKDQLREGISSLVAVNDKVQALINDLEEACQKIEENSRTQKQSVCEKFSRVFSILDERRKVMTQQISSEQEEKTGHVQALVRCYGDSVEANSKLVERAVSSMEDKDMAAFVQNSRELIPKVITATGLCPAEKLKPGYESMSHYRFNFSRQETALKSIDFLKAEEDVPEQPEVEQELEEPNEPSVLNKEPTDHQETSNQNLEPVNELLPTLISPLVEPVRTTAPSTPIPPGPGLVMDSVEPAGADRLPESDDSNQMKNKMEEEREEAQGCAAADPVKEGNVCEHQEGMSTTQCEGGHTDGDAGDWTVQSDTEERRDTQDEQEEMQIKEEADATSHPSWCRVGPVPAEVLPREQTMCSPQAAEHEEDEEDMQGWVCLTGAVDKCSSSVDDSFDLGEGGLECSSDKNTSPSPTTPGETHPELSDGGEEDAEEKPDEDMLDVKCASELEHRGLGQAGFEAEMMNERLGKRSKDSGLEKDAESIGEEDDSVDGGGGDGGITNSLIEGDGGAESGSSGFAEKKEEDGENSEQLEEKITSPICLQAVTLLFYLLAFLVILQRVWAYIGCFICT